uniref:Coiled-coil domain containing 83 n=1 Tax=Esox lucius TaxID=8010 RepID=A0A3P8Z074_ESOLU
MSKSSEEKKSTLAEAFINFQLQVKRKEIQEFQEEIRQLDCAVLTQREQLKEEQMGHIRLLRKQAKELEQKLEQREVVNKEQVDQALQQNLELIHRQEKELAELRAEVSRLGEEVLVLQGERHIWQEYKMVGSQWHQQQIQHLEAELAHVQRGFQEMAGRCTHWLGYEVQNQAHLFLELKSFVATKKRRNLFIKSNKSCIQKQMSNLRLCLFLHRQYSALERSGRGGREPWGVYFCATSSWQWMQSRQQKDPRVTISPCCYGRFQARQDASYMGSHLPFFHSSLPCAVQHGDMHLGLLEQKLLCVVGQSLPLHPVVQAPEDWPVTPLLQNLALVLRRH